jgi:hypothetical protein
VSRLDPARLHVTFAPGVSPQGPVIPRAYTLTHSDSTGELFLTVGSTYDRRQISGWYTRLMRDEVLAEWQAEDSPRLDVHCHVSGGLVVGSARWRYDIFRGHLPMVIEAFRHGDRELFAAHPHLDEARVMVRFHSARARFDVTEDWGRLRDYRGTAATA